MIGIYKITNLKTNCSYIGQSVNVQRRINEHRSSHNGKIGTIDYYILREGVDNFSFEILEECPIEDLNNREIYYIEFFDTFRNGYNLTPGGECWNWGENNVNAILTKQDVIDIRIAYNNHESRKNVYERYKNKICFSGFAHVWTGRNWPHVMPEVFTEENKKWHIQHAGHMRAIFSDEEVLQIRTDYIDMTLNELYKKYNFCSKRCIKGIVNGENYKYLPLYKKQKGEWIDGGTY